MANYRLTLNFDVKSISTVKIGGIIKKFYEVYNPLGLKEVLKELKKNNETYYVIGGCSKILFPDIFLRDALICLKNDFIKCQKNVVVVGAGTLLKKFAHFMTNHGYSGFSGLVSIPGQVGGAIVNNAGAFNDEISTNLVSIKVYHNGRFKTLKKEELDFSYRTSRLKHESMIVLEATFKKVPRDKSALQSEARANILKRIESQPHQVLTLGSTFKNKKGQYIAQVLDSIGVKGLALNGVRVSSRHANFLENYDNCTQKNFLNILVILRTLVYNKLGYNAEFEVIILRW